MIERKGTQICEQCKYSYDWVAIFRTEGEFNFGPIKDLHGKNIKFCGLNNGRLIATSICPNCGIVQIKNVVDEPLP